MHYKKSIMYANRVYFITTFWHLCIVHLHVGSQTGSCNKTNKIFMGINFADTLLIAGEKTFSYWLKRELSILGYSVKSLCNLNFMNFNQFEIGVMAPAK